MAHEEGEKSWDAGSSYVDEQDIVAGRRAIDATESSRGRSIPWRLNKVSWQYGGAGVRGWLCSATSSLSLSMKDLILTMAARRQSQSTPSNRQPQVSVSPLHFPDLSTMTERVKFHQSFRHNDLADFSVEASPGRETTATHRRWGGSIWLGRRPSTGCVVKASEPIGA